MSMKNGSMRGILATFLLTLLLLPGWAQKMNVERFKQVKFDLLNHTLLPVDKKQATLDLLTDEKGFEFKADGQTEVKAVEGEGKLTLMTPHKTKFLVIKHPDYGQTTWKVPGRGLKKKKHYQANLLTDKPGKEYKLTKQWVVFKVEPANAILQLDSTTVLLRNGVAQLNVPVGKHSYRVEAPFYEALSDSLELTDSAKLTVPVVLQSFYSYLTVRTPLPEATIVLDGQPIGKGAATSGHLLAGEHHLMVVKGGMSYYDGVVSVGRSEKKIVELGKDDYKLNNGLNGLATNPITLKRQVVRADSVVDGSADGDTLAALTLTTKAPVTLIAPDDSTEIWVNREPVAVGKWEGKLELGYYVVNTRKGRLESGGVPLWVDDELPKLLDLSAPKASYGVLNIHSNVVGATIYINKVKVGQTPYIVENLPADKPCRVRLALEGFRDAEAIITPVGNDMTDVNLKLTTD